ncbi:hypothetical protein VTN96DRAFT_5348 [Rasamsonia emersonii]
MAAMERTSPKQVGSIAEFLLENDNLYKDSPGMRQKTLHWAARNGNTEIMENLLSQETEDSEIGRTLLWAAVGGQESAVQWLLDKFTQGDPKCILHEKDMIHAVQAAAHNGHEKVVQQLLSHMMGSLEDTKSWTALHWAVNWTKPEAVFVVKHLLMNGANPEATNGDTSDTISALDMAKQPSRENPAFKDKIVGLLESPLRLPRKPLPLTVPSMEGVPDICKQLRSNIIDFYFQDNRFYTLERTSPVSDVVYGEGPEKIMSKARDIWETEWTNEHAQRFRWVHLPANNWIWAEDLMRMVSCESTKSDGDYTRLKNFEQNRREHLGPPQCRFMYPALRFETKDFRSGEGSSIARLQGKSVQQRGKDRKPKTITKPGQDNEVIPGGEVVKDQTPKSIGPHRPFEGKTEDRGQNLQSESGGQEAHTGEVTTGAVPISGEATNNEMVMPETEMNETKTDYINKEDGRIQDTGPKDSKAEGTTTLPTAFDRREGQMDVKQQQQRQKDTKETVRDAEGAALEGCKLAICMPFLTLQTVDSQRKLRQAITLTELYPEWTAIDPDGKRTAKIDEMKEGYKLLYKTNMPNIKRGEELKEA